jgi:hypothetical protein
MSGAIPLLPLYVFMAWTGEKLYMYLSVMWVLEETAVVKMDVGGSNFV